MKETLVSRVAKPTATSVGAQVYQTANPLGHAIVVPSNQKQHQLAYEGSYFVGRNAIPGTGIVGHAAPTTLDPTKPLLTMHVPANGTKRIFLDFIRLYLTAAGTGSTNVRFTGKTDRGAAGATRRSSGGTAITPINPNHGSAVTSDFAGTGVHFGAVVASAEVDARIVCDAIHRSVIGVVGDSYQLNFGGAGRSPNALLTSGTAIAHTVFDHPPVVIGPGDMFLLHQWSASQSGAITFEFEMGWWEQ